MGGINDMFTRIVLSCEYALKTNRFLMIDTYTTEFNSAFFHYFNPKITNYKDFRLINLEYINQISTYPNFIQGRVNSYVAEHECDGSRFYRDTLTKEVMKVDLSLNYPEDLLVYHACGGGVHSARFFDYFTLKNKLINQLAKRLKSIDGEFIGIHIRNTDIKTEYFDEMFTILSLSAGTKIFISTDSLTSKLQVEAAANLYGCKVFSFTKKLSKNDLPIHRNVSLNENDVKSRNVDAILDLLTLVLASKLYYFKTKNGHISGFSRLAENLSNSPFKIRLLSLINSIL